MALEAGHHPCRVMSSNPGQALWTGIVEEDRAGRVVHRLMRPDLFTGWGIRTLSCKERRYNPMGYHLGTVWPHDNSLIAAGFRRYGYDEPAARIFVGLLEAALAGDLGQPRTIELPPTGEPADVAHVAGAERTVVGAQHEDAVEVAHRGRFLGHHAREVVEALLAVDRLQRVGDLFDVLPDREVHLGDEREIEDADESDDRQRKKQRERAGEPYRRTLQ